MDTTAIDDLPDNTPVIIGAGQYTEHIPTTGQPPLSSPMSLAAQASAAALHDAGIRAGNIDTIAVIRLFSDSVPAWACPFGGTDNPPESIARIIQAIPDRRIYSNAGGTQPLQLLRELFTDIARGETQVALLASAEAIASQRFAQRNGLAPAGPVQ
jgi:acetyl-CoA C-acetyltransferase